MASKMAPKTMSRPASRPFGALPERPLRSRRRLSPRGEEEEDAEEVEDRRRAPGHFGVTA